MPMGGDVREAQRAIVCGVIGMNQALLRLKELVGRWLLRHAIIGMLIITRKDCKIVEVRWKR